ncbi:MAG: WGR domain-containing protein [Sulfuritalea sp.]|nr:WGR domain-containing protein [Sulfuritalea sp.]
MAKVIDQADLHYQDNRSDKVYHVQIVQNDDGTFSVPFQYGRRGSTLNTGEKVSGVSSSSAHQQFQKVVDEKRKKGYQFSSARVAPIQAPLATSITPAGVKAGEDTGVRPQLLNEVSEEDLDTVLDDPSWMLQEKMDGHRRLIRVDTRGIIGINRDGQATPLPAEVGNRITGVLGTALIDGELVGVKYYAFDLLEDGETDVRGLPAVERHQRLVQLFGGERGGSCFTIVTSYTDPRVKRLMLNRITANRGEGVVFKRADAPYESGRPNSGGTQLKWKLYATATVKIADGREGKRSVAILGRNGEMDVPLGNVTIPANHEIPATGTYAEVRYLYAYPGGSLYQPTYLGPRDDKHEADPIASLKYKAEVEAAA